MPPLSLEGGFEGGLDDPLAAQPGEDDVLKRDLLRKAGVVPAAGGAVFALDVLPEEEDVDIAGLVALQRRFEAFVENDGPEVDVEIERAPDGKQELLQRDVIGNVRPADRAEQDGVVFLQLVEIILGRHPAGLVVEVASPGIAGELKPEAPLQPGERLQDSYALGDDFCADTVAGEKCNAMPGHEGIL